MKMGIDVMDMSKLPNSEDSDYDLLFDFTGDDFDDMMVALRFSAGFSTRTSSVEEG